jgi:hypothetical protein
MEISENGIKREFDSVVRFNDVGRFNDVFKARRTYAGSEV